MCSCHIHCALISNTIKCSCFAGTVLPIHQDLNYQCYRSLRRSCRDFASPAASLCAMYHSIHNPVSWTLAASYIMVFAWAVWQVVGILRARHNPQSFLFIFLALVIGYIPLRAAIFFVDKADSTSPIIVLFLLPVSLQFAAFSIWALWFSTIEGGWR